MTPITRLSRNYIELIANLFSFIWGKFCFAAPSLLHSFLQTKDTIQPKRSTSYIPQLSTEKTTTFAHFLFELTNELSGSSTVQWYACLLGSKFHSVQWSSIQEKHAGLEPKSSTLAGICSNVFAVQVTEYKSCHCFFLLQASRTILQNASLENCEVPEI